MGALPVLLVAALVAGCGGAATTEVDGVQDILADEAERGFSGVVLVRHHAARVRRARVAHAEKVARRLVRALVDGPD